MATARLLPKFRHTSSWLWPRYRDVRFWPIASFSLPCEAGIEAGDPQQPIELIMTYDEFDIAATFAYRGKAFQLPDVPPSPAEILDDDGSLLLAGFMLKRQADRVPFTSKNGRCLLELHFRQ